MNPKEKIIAIDFFCSGGGMSYGLNSSGIKVIAGLDIDIKCKETYEFNIPNSKFIHADITKFTENELQEKINIKKDDKNMVFIGCSPCQFWTLLNTDKTKSQKTKNLLKEFSRFVIHYLPGYVVIENVPGILSRKEESKFEKFKINLEKNGYKIKYKIVNLNNYGVPQSRKRFALIATRVNKKPIFPKAEKRNFPCVKDFIGIQNGFPKIDAGYSDTSEFMHTCSNLSPKNLKRIRMTKTNGGNRLDWANTDLQLDAYKRRDNKFFTDTYSRMFWHKPSPTITTKFFSFSNGRFGHPDEDRAISIREGATLQTFPKNFIFKTKGITSAAKIIGNAVPPEFAKRIGKSIIGSKDHE